MATATIIKKIRDVGDPQYESNLYYVQLEDGRTFNIKAGGWEEDYAVIVRTYFEVTFQEIAEIIEGCFVKESNFFEKVSEYFKCNNFIILDYNHTSVWIDSTSSSAKEIISNWKDNQSLYYNGIYYVIGVRKLRTNNEYDGTCLVLASSEESAINKVERKCGSCQCTCFGTYNRKEDTFLLKDAKHYLKLDFMNKIEF